MDPFKIVGLYSPAPESGKSTAAKYLQSDMGFLAMSFSSPMKLLILRFILGFYAGGGDERAAGTWANQFFENKNLPIQEIPGAPTMRHLLDSFGSTWGRNEVNENVWVEQARRRVDLLQNDGRFNGAVFDDVRHQNEADMIRSLGGKLIKIVMPGLVTPDLQSEGNLEDLVFDSIVFNAGSKGDLFKSITGAVRGLFN